VFVPLEQLARAVEARLAQLTGNEACHVTSGAAAGIAIAVAACIAGTEPAAIEDLLKAASPREVVLQRSQRNGFENVARLTGATVREIGAPDQAPSRDELRRALSPRTACVLVFAGSLFEPALPLVDVVALAHAAGVPVVVDAAAQIPPIANLSRLTRDIGVDLAIFSGGKALRGPQTTGLIVGRADLIAACVVNDAPRMAFGRPMKVGKEELLGILAAVEWATRQDESAVLEACEHRVRAWIDALQGRPGITVGRLGQGPAGEPVPRALVRFDDAVRCRQVIDCLASGQPGIAVAAMGGDGLALNPQFLDGDEPMLVLERVRAALSRSDASCR
jgi:L-seryl-tRNA(Ser) seleniumtransferase